MPQRLGILKFSLFGIYVSSPSDIPFFSSTQFFLLCPFILNMSQLERGTYWYFQGICRSSPSDILFFLSASSH